MPRNIPQEKIDLLPIALTDHVPFVTEGDAALFILGPEASPQDARNVRAVLHGLVGVDKLNKLSIPIFRTRECSAAASPGPVYRCGDFRPLRGSIEEEIVFDSRPSTKPPGWSLDGCGDYVQGRYEISRATWKGLADRLSERHGVIGETRNVTVYAAPVEPKYNKVFPRLPLPAALDALRSASERIYLAHEYEEIPRGDQSWRNNNEMRLSLSLRLSSLLIRDPLLDLRHFVGNESVFLTGPEHYPQGFFRTEGGIMAVYCGAGCTYETLELIHAFFEHHLLAPEGYIGDVDLTTAHDAANFCTGYLVF